MSTGRSASALCCLVALAACHTELRFDEPGAEEEAAPAFAPGEDGAPASLVADGGVGSSSPDASACLLSSGGRCVECLETAHCAAGQVCHAERRSCLQTCNDDVDCPTSPRGCRDGLCAECWEDDHCDDFPDRQQCDNTTRRCVQCTEDDDCGGNKRCDPLGLICVSA